VGAKGGERKGDGKDRRKKLGKESTQVSWEVVGRMGTGSIGGGRVAWRSQGRAIVGYC